MRIVSTKTKDSLQFKGLISEPKEKSNQIIIHIHGLSGDFYSNKYYHSMHDLYPQNDLAFLSGENRGTHLLKAFNTNNGSKIIGSSLEIFEKSSLDIDAWVKLALKLGYQKVWLQGHSLGSLKIAHFLKEMNQDKVIKGAILLSPFDILGLTYLTSAVKQHQVLIKEAHELEKEGKPQQILSQPLWREYYFSAQTYLNLFQKNSRAAIFNYGLPELGWKTVNQIKVPIIAFTGTKDEAIIPVISAKKAMTKLENELIGSPKKQTHVLAGATHGFADFGLEIVKKVVDFIKS